MDGLGWGAPHIDMDQQAETREKVWSPLLIHRLKTFGKPCQYTTHEEGLGGRREMWLFTGWCQCQEVWFLRYLFIFFNPAQKKISCTESQTVSYRHRTPVGAKFLPYKAFSYNTRNVSLLSIAASSHTFHNHYLLKMLKPQRPCEETASEGCCPCLVPGSAPSFRSKWLFRLFAVSSSFWVGCHTVSQLAYPIPRIHEVQILY